MHSDKPLRLYVDPAWRREDLLHSFVLFPWWGNPPSGGSVLLLDMLLKNRNLDTSQYEVTDKREAANMVFMPYSHSMVRRKYPELLALCSQRAEEMGVPLLIDGVEDILHPIRTPHTYVLRYGGYRFEPNPQDITIPPLANDLLEIYYDSELKLREKQPGKPVVAFAGWGKLPFARMARAFVKSVPDCIKGLLDARARTKVKGIFWRARAMRVLERSPLIESNFIVRASYSGHARTAEKSVEVLQKEMVDNLLESDYGLDVRGDPNTSTRLFETVSLGRIPVILDTERILPFSDRLDYASFALIVDFRDIRRLPERISAFHNALTPERFIEMQRNARAAFVDYFRLDALMGQIILELKSRSALA